MHNKIKQNTQNEKYSETKAGVFIMFFPILTYNGSSMKEVDAQDILDIALVGTSATLLAKQRESVMLVYVDNYTPKHLLASPKAMKTLIFFYSLGSSNYLLVLPLYQPHTR